MISLKKIDVDPLDINSVLKSSYIQELLSKNKKCKEPQSNESNKKEIEIESLQKILSDFDQSVDQLSSDNVTIILIDILLIFNDQNSLPQQIIDEFIASNFFQNINVCICNLYQPELATIICFILNCLAYLSDDLIVEGMFKNETLCEMMNVFVDEENLSTISILFYLFGNSCIIGEIASEFSNILFELINSFLCQNYINSIKIQKSCLFCLFSLIKHSPIPEEYICPIFTIFKNLIASIICKTPDINETENSILSYIIDILDVHSNDSSQSYYVVQTMIPSYLLGCIQDFPQIPRNYQYKFLKIICNTMKMIPAGEDVSLFQRLEYSVLSDLLDSDDNDVISIVYDVLCQIEFYDKTIIREFIEHDIINQSIQLIDSVNFYAKMSILNFLALLLTEDVENEFSDMFVTETVVKEFVEIADQEEKSVNINGAIYKLYTLTYEQEELNSLLEPFAI